MSDYYYKYIVSARWSVYALSYNFNLSRRFIINIGVSYFPEAYSLKGTTAVVIKHPKVTG